MCCRNLAKSKSKVEGRYSKEWPTVVVFHGTHNHALSSAAALKYRDLGIETKERLCQLFRQGHSASSALHCLKTDLLIKHGDKYYENMLLMGIMYLVCPLLASCLAKNFRESMAVPVVLIC